MTLVHVASIFCSLCGALAFGILLAGYGVPGALLGVIAGLVGGWFGGPIAALALLAFRVQRVAG